MNRHIIWSGSAIALIAMAAFLTACGKDTDTQTPATDDTPYEGPVPGAVLEEEDPVRPGLVYFTNVQGAPYTAGGTFSVDVALQGEGTPYIQAYQMRVAYDDTIVSLVRIEDIELGGSPPDLGKRYGQDSGVESGVEQSFATLGNFDNRKTDLTFCRLHFQVLTAPDGPYSLRLVEDPPNQVLVTVDFKGAPYVFDDSATDPMPRS